jgi:hypothetical protein
MLRSVDISYNKTITPGGSMKRLVVVPPYVARLKIRDIRSATRRRTPGDTKVVDLRAYTGRNVLRFPRTSGPTPAA